MPRELGQRAAVDGHAGGLHSGQHGDERQLQLVEDSVELGSSLARSVLERLARGGDRDATDGRVVRHRAARQSCGSSMLEALGADVAERLAAQRGIEDVRGDLRVHGHGRQRASVSEHVAGGSGVATSQLPDEQLLGFVADERPAGGKDQVGEALRVLRPGGDRSAVPRP